MRPEQHDRLLAILREDGDPDPADTHDRGHALVEWIEQRADSDEIRLRRADTAILLRYIRNGVLVNRELEAMLTDGRATAPPRRLFDVLLGAALVAALLLAWMVLR